MNVYTLEIKVPPSAIDQLNHVNNIVYLQWIQKVAKQHWEAATTTAFRQGFYWVVKSHFIEYLAPAFLDQELTINTWVQDYNAAISERHTEIIRKSDQKCIAKAKTLWCLINSATNKPMRISSELKKQFP